MAEEETQTTEVVDAETATATVTETAPETKETTAPPPDPYAGLSDEDAADAREYDTVTKDLPANERAIMLRYARAGLKAGKDAADKVVADKVVADKKAAEKAGKDGEVAALRKEVAELQGRQVRDDQVRAQQAQRGKFETDMGAAFKDASGRSGTEKMVRNIVLGGMADNHMEHGGRRAFDVAAATKSAVEEVNKMVGEQTTEKRDDWLNQKLNDEDETLGDGGGGAATAARGDGAQEIGDLDQGGIADAIIREHNLK
jgi:hypothetical protein